MSSPLSHRKEGQSAHDLLNKFSEQEVILRGKRFFAPYGSGCHHATVKILGVNYRFRIVGFQNDGFGVFEPIDPTCAKFVREAEYEESKKYLELFPPVHVILVCETDVGWCAYPFNSESFKTKMGISREIIVRNVSDVERFDVITARSDSHQFWYDEPFSGGDVLKSEKMREVFKLRASAVAKKHFEKITGTTPEDIKAFDLALKSWRLFVRSSTEDVLRSVLADGQSVLDSYVIRGNQIEVNWKSERGAFYNSVVDKETLDVISPGICLEGEDAKFNFKDLPGVMREGERRGVIYRTRDTRLIDVDDDG